MSLMGLEEGRWILDVDKCTTRTVSLLVQTIPALEVSKSPL